MSLPAPAQGIRRYPSLTSYFQRGTTPLEVWYGLGLQNQTAFSTASITINTFGINAFVVSRTVVLDRLAFEVTTVGGAGSVGRCGIYRATSLTNDYPKELVVDGGEFDCNAATGVKAATVSATLIPGVYWFALLSGVSAFTARATAAASTFPNQGVDNALSTVIRNLTVARAYGALPSTFPAGAALNNNTQGLMAVRIVS